MFNYKFWCKYKKKYYLKKININNIKDYKCYNMYSLFLMIFLVIFYRCLLSMFCFIW